MIDKLIGIYNAKGSVVGEVQYFFGKLLGQTHCALCDITHGSFNEKADFTSCRDALTIPFENLHLDELDSQLESYRDSAPCVIAISKSVPTLLITTSELERCHGDVTHFFELLDQRIISFLSL
jgi:hypothetical protein